MTYELRPEERKDEEASRKEECSGWRSGRRGRKTSEWFLLVQHLSGIAVLSLVGGGESL